MTIFNAVNQRRIIIFAYKGTLSKRSPFANVASHFHRKVVYFSCCCVQRNKYKVFNFFSFNFFFNFFNLFNFFSISTIKYSYQILLLHFESLFSSLFSDTRLRFLSIDRKMFCDSILIFSGPYETRSSSLWNTSKHKKNLIQHRSVVRFPDFCPYEERTPAPCHFWLPGEQNMCELSWVVSAFFSKSQSLGWVVPFAKHRDRFSGCELVWRRTIPRLNTVFFKQIFWSTTTAIRLFYLCLASVAYFRLIILKGTNSNKTCW